MKFQAGCCLATLALATGAFAQETRPFGLSVRAGFFFPASQEAEREAKTWVTAGLEYKLGDLRFRDAESDYSAQYSISVDYFGRGDFRSVPVLANYVGRFDQLYYSVGAGVSFARAPQSFTRVSNKTEFAYSLAVGYDFTRGTTPFFVEGRYHGNGDSRLAGFALLAGVRL